MFYQVTGVNIEHVPEKIAETLELPINGGNCICVDKDSDFGKWLIDNNVQFEETW